MREIPLTKGYVALVDDEDYDRVSQFKWCVSERKTRNYALNRKTGLLHRFILNVTETHIQVDHDNLNGLDCRRENMRLATNSKNQANQNKETSRKTSSKYKGVCFFKRTRKWTAYCAKDKKTHYLGYFASEVEAAEAYDIAAVELHGEFARTNFDVVPDMV